jgi:hypothetical protein
MSVMPLLSSSVEMYISRRVASHPSTSIKHPCVCKICESCSEICRVTHIHSKGRTKSSVVATVSSRFVSFCVVLSRSVGSLGRCPFPRMMHGSNPLHEHDPSRACSVSIESAQGNRVSAVYLLKDENILSWHTCLYALSLPNYSINLSKSPTAGLVSILVSEYPNHTNRPSNCAIIST